jgi:hypothetical protein
MLCVLLEELSIFFGGPTVLRASTLKMEAIGSFKK